MSARHAPRRRRADSLPHGQGSTAGRTVAEVSGWLLRVVVAATTVLLVTAGCARENQGDPGNRRLKTLRNDAAFALRPPGARLIDDVAFPAKARGSEYFSGPQATRRYELPGAATTALSFYDTRLAALGWESQGTAERPEFSKDVGGWTRKLELFADDRELLVAIEGEPVLIKRHHFGNLLDQSSAAGTVGSYGKQLGEPHFFGVFFPRPLGKEPVELRDVRIMKIDDGMVVDGIWAVRYSELGGGGYIGGTGGEEAAARLRPHLHDVKEVRLNPTCPRSGACPEPGVQDWYLLAEVHITKPGHLEASGLRVAYQADGRGNAESFPMKVFLDSAR